MGGKIKKKKQSYKNIDKFQKKSKTSNNATKVNKSKNDPYQSTRKKQLQEANKDEDKTIKRLEKLLKLNKRKGKKNLPSSFKDDGLNYLLNIIDKDDQNVLSDFSEDMEEDLAIIKGKNTLSDKNETSERPDIFENASKKRTLSELMKEKGIQSDDSVSDGGKAEYDSESSDQTDYEMESGDGMSDEDSNDEVEKTKDKPDMWEDIYGRLRDKAGNVLKNTESNAYIPPKLRNKVLDQSEQENEKQLRIKRQLKGLVNRLSESNIQNICHQIEEMYMKNSRNAMNETIFCLMSELLFTSTLTPPRLILDQAMLIALLHANVGSEIGAYFLQHIVEKFDELHSNFSGSNESKEINNILIFLSHLHNFKVTNSTLIFDIFNLLTKTFTPKDIELIHLFLKNIGFVIRKEDPLKLKELISLIQVKASSLQSEENDSRVRFMLDILMAIRNNNMYKIPDYDPTLTEHRKKLLKGFIRKGCSITELSISYDDLLNVDKRGRWWIVGSAWEENLPSTDACESNSTKNIIKSVASEKMLELAQKQHMNTEIRKSIFCIIMSAEDFMDAFEKLLKLNLKNEQEREIINVIIHCALSEKTFNPYYAYLAGKFCTFARKYQISLQFSLWDRFKELNNMKPLQLNNLSRFLIHLLTTGALPLSVLKVIHFSEMNKTLVRFFRQILMAILLHDNEEVVTRAFQRISAADNLKLLREGLRLFMLHFLLKNEKKMEPDIAVKLQKRIKLAEEILNASKHAFKL